MLGEKVEVPDPYPQARRLIDNYNKINNIETRRSSQHLHSLYTVGMWSTSMRI